MKIKVPMWLLCGFAYAMQIPFMVLIIMLVLSEYAPPTAVFWTLVGLSAFLCLVTLTISLVNLILSAVNLRKQVDKPYKLTMAVKLSLIPFYIINLVLWFICTGIVMNPFLFIFVPVILAVSISSTYVFMLATSVHNISYLIKTYLKERKLKYVVYVVLHFIFCADVIAAIVSAVKERDKPFCP